MRNFKWILDCTFLEFELLLRLQGTIENFDSRQINVPFSIKRTLFKFFKSSLLNVPCDLKNGGLNIYKQGTYNREQRVSKSFHASVRFES